MVNSTESSRLLYNEMKLKQATLSGGTSLLETLVVIQLPLLLHLIIILFNFSFPYRLIAKSKVAIEFFYEFFLFIVPLILFVTYLSEFVYFIYVALVIICIFAYYARIRTLSKNPYNSFPVIKIEEEKNTLITRFRSLVNIFSALCILAVDFNIFPTRFAKTETFGYGLMDIGAGLYVISNGLVVTRFGAVRGKSFNLDLKQAVLKSFPLLLLGIARSVAVKLLSYQQHVSEYGVHWNFFITLSALKIINTVLVPRIDVKRVCYINVAIVSIYQYVLSNGLQDWIFSDTPRQTFLDANKEGIFSVIGYEVLFLCAVVLGDCLPRKGDDVKNYLKLSLKLFSWASFFCILTTCCHFTVGISRRTANSGYVLWILTITLIATGVGSVAESLLFAVCMGKRSYSEYSVPLILRAVNEYGVKYFLLANLITGFINITVNTALVGKIQSFIILITYMFICTGAISVMYYKNNIARHA